MKRHYVSVNRDVLEWAILESQINRQQVILKYPSINSWLSYNSRPTVNQLKSLSNYLSVPFGMFFLQRPPIEDSFKTEFRTISNKHIEISKDLKDVIVSMSYKRDWISSFRKDNGLPRVQFSKDLDFDDVSKVVEYMYHILNLERYWNIDQKTTADAIDLLRNRIEQLNILVMQNGIVKENTHRSLDVNEFRAFALYDEYAPLIFINRNDSYSGRLFSLVHEFIHILMGEDDIVNVGIDVIQMNERKINEIVAEFLMPEEYFKKEYDLASIDLYSKELKVSKYAVAFRLFNLGLVDSEMVDIVEDRMKRDLDINSSRSSSGGNYYDTKINRLGTPFIESVIIAAETGHLRYTDAYSLLDINSKNFNSLKSKVGF